MKHLQELVNKSIHILREAKGQFKNPIVLWSTGKDSTAMLSLIEEAYGVTIPFPVVHLDTSYKFPEIYRFRDKLAKEWGFDLQVAQNKEALEKGMNPMNHSHFECCTALKTQVLKKYIKENKVDAVIVSIRRDEHSMRNIERYYSPRDKEFKWHIVKPKTKREMKEGDSPFIPEQQPELWDLYQTDFGKNCDHVRIHPILHWDEIDVWNYLKDRNLPINPLYFSKNGLRYRSLGCKCCTTPIKSNASTIDEIIEELKTTKTKERDGRSQDKEEIYIMRRLRSLGYM